AERDPDRPVEGRVPRSPPQPALGVVLRLRLLRWRHTLLDRGHPFLVEEAPACRAVDHEGHDRHTGDDGDDQRFGAASHLSLIGKGTLLRRPADRAARTRGPTYRSTLGPVGRLQLIFSRSPATARVDGVSYASKPPSGFRAGDALGEE